MKRATGWIPSPPDPKDWGIGKLVGSGVGAPESSLILLPHISFVADQELSESCVLQAIQQQHYLSQLHRGVAKPVRMSSLFSYYASRAQHGLAGADLGTIPRFAWKAIAGLGICSEATWPFSMDKVDTKPSLKAFREASDQKWLEGYYSILETGSARVDAVKRALAAGYPIVFGMLIGKDFHNCKDGIYQVPNQVENSHMVCLVGYEPDFAWVISSWGSLWGTKPRSITKVSGGFAKISWDVISWDGAGDFWAATHAVEFI